MSGVTGRRMLSLVVFAVNCAACKPETVGSVSRLLVFW